MADQTLKPENVTFLCYIEILNVTYAIFSDHQDGSNFPYSRAECEKRLTNLKANGISSEETQKTLDSWPDD